ncbi:MAG: hypothetical protein AB2L21_02310 [Anaerolineaceae bacterium]|jgi:hypothetical protein
MLVVPPIGCHPEAMTLSRALDELNNSLGGMAHPIYRQRSEESYLVTKIDKRVRQGTRSDSG